MPCPHYSSPAFDVACRAKFPCSLGACRRFLSVPGEGSWRGSPPEKPSQNRHVGWARHLSDPFVGKGSLHGGPMALNAPHARRLTGSARRFWSNPVGGGPVAHGAI